MSRRHATSHRNRCRKTGLQGTKRMIGVGSAMGAFLAFGTIPVVTAPPAQADAFGLASLIDLIVAPSSWADGSETWASFDWFGTPDIDTGLAAADPGVLAGTGDFGWSAIIDEWIYQPLHTGMEAWIHSDVG